MQITLNKVAFDLKPVEGRLRAALLAEPTLAPGVRREVWAHDGAQGRFLAPATREGALVLPTGLAVFVARPGENGAGPRKAEGPTAKMAERFLAAIGAKSFQQVMQAMARVTGVPQVRPPLAAFKDVKGPWRLVAETDFAVVEMASAARNLSAYAVMPGLVVFSHVQEEGAAATEGGPAPGTIRPGVVLPPATQAAMGMRRLAMARRMQEMQAELGDTRPADLPPGDPRRAAVARLGAEWRALQPKAKAA